MVYPYSKIQITWVSVQVTYYRTFILSMGLPNIYFFRSHFSYFQFLLFLNGIMINQSWQCPVLFCVQCNGYPGEQNQSKQLHGINADVLYQTPCGLFSSQRETTLNFRWFFKNAFWEQMSFWSKLQHMSPIARK